MNPYKFLLQFKKYGKKGGFNPGLKRVNKLLSYLGNPQDKVDYIHIGGSNGKGSTAALLTSILRENGYKVGTYISPPLIHFNERFKVDNLAINTHELKGIVNQLKDIFEDSDKDIKLEDPSFFEIITVIAFQYFYEKNIDIGILEVGLGGRLDATNAIKSSLLSIITNISYEHADILGPEIKDIAFEKAGIIKSKVPIITGADNEEALSVFREKSSQKKSRLIILEDEVKYEIKNKNLDFQTFNLQYDDKSFKNLKLNILGDHQITNAALSIRALDLLPEQYNIKKESIYNGLANCEWPGRLEVMQRNPDIILDGAHNVDGIKRLVEFLDEYIEEDKKVYFLISILKDKDYKEMLKLIKSLKHEKDFVITRNQNERSLPQITIKNYAEKLDIKNDMYDNIYEAVKSTYKKLQKGDIFCITGSLYTVAEARFYTYLLKEGGLQDGKKEKI
ncbi:MAG TPA: folylpolyglutamate synthase/dihydrofolate synthase family protein [Halanaerobiales bacterium]|nr:folylpolyglutamate synthase/dihydrofolate synthase family protein [Halanaerobiales bacterium]